MELEKLRLSRDEMRSLGHAVIEMLIEHVEDLERGDPGGKGSRPDLERRFQEPPPESGCDPGALLARLRDEIFPATMHVDHPRFFAFVPSPGNFVGAMADALASGFNSFVGTWFAGSGPAEIELVTIEWLRQLCGLPESAGGLFVSGGSMANLTALAVARHHRIGYEIRDAVAYYSDQTHSSVERAFRVLGFAPAQMRRLPSDDAFRLPLDVLAQEVARDRGMGRRPFCVVANAGTTNTGAVDPIPALARFCREQGLWLHADGAYGAAAVLTDRARQLLAGLEEVDSLSLDPHKWLFQPFEIGCLLLREGNCLKEAFRIMPEYLRDVHKFEEEVNFCDRGVQLTRGFHALKLWMSIKTFGLGAFRRAIAHGICLAEAAERRLRERPEWQVVTPAQLAVITFRYAPPDRSPEEIEAIQQKLIAGVLGSGFAILTSTTLRGQTALRLCTINPRTSEADVLATIDHMEELAAKM